MEHTGRIRALDPACRSNAQIECKEKNRMYHRTAGSDSGSTRTGTPGPRRCLMRGLPAGVSSLWLRPHAIVMRARRPTLAIDIAEGFATFAGSELANNIELRLAVLGIERPLLG